MGFYSEVIIPQGLEWVMSQPVFADYRRQLLAEVSGQVLEIGFGTGLNLSHYSENVAKLIAIDANKGMKKFVQKRIDAANMKVALEILNGENLPMEDNSFDSVVCTWTLCSIRKVEKAIEEIHRVLKPGGKFFFIEHGLSEEDKVKVWQNRLTPIQKIIADGCHLNRNMEQLVGNKFSNLTLSRFYAPNLPKFIGYMYQGIATKS